jgi:hypothetical protein
MSNVSDEIKNRIEALPDYFLPLKTLLSRYISSGCTIQEGAIRVGRFRKYQHDHYRVTVFPPAHPDWLIRASENNLPLDYIKLLSYMNGCSVFSMGFFGFTPSMQEDPPHLDRRRLQCLDLTTANERWIINFKNLPRGRFYVGGRSYSHAENLGYFMLESGRMEGYLCSGERISSWESIWHLLSVDIEDEEIRISEGKIASQQPDKDSPAD